MRACVTVRVHVYVFVWEGREQTQRALLRLHLFLAVAQTCQTIPSNKCSVTSLAVHLTAAFSGPQLRVEVADTAYPTETATTTVDIQVVRNEFVPIFSASPYRTVINETTEVGVGILQVSASDQDGVSSASLAPLASTTHRLSLHVQREQRTETHADTRRRMQINAETRRYTQTHADTRRHTQTHADTHRHTQIHTDTDTRRHTDTHIRRHTQTHADTHRHTQINTETRRHMQSCYVSPFFVFDHMSTSHTVERDKVDAYTTVFMKLLLVLCFSRGCRRKMAILSTVWSFLTTLTQILTH